MTLPIVNCEAEKNFSKRSMVKTLAGPYRPLMTQASFVTASFPQLPFSASWVGRVSSQTHLCNGWAGSPDLPCKPLGLRMSCRCPAWRLGTGEMRSGGRYLGLDLRKAASPLALGEGSGVCCSGGVAVSYCRPDDVGRKITMISFTECLPDETRSPRMPEINILITLAAWGLWTG